MSSFTQPLILKFLDREQRDRPFELVESFEYHVHALNSGDVITVPAGYCTDFATVPRPLWSILPPVGRYGKAAVIHDYLCDTEERPRKESDMIFREAMEVLNVTPWKITIMYLGVRLWSISAPFRQWLRCLFQNCDPQPGQTI